MSENLELRKQALLASGQWREKKADVAWEDGPDWLVDDHGNWGPPKRLPAVESDPGVSEPWFLKWAWKNDFGWQLETGVTYDDVKWPLFTLTISADRGEGMLSEELFTVEGATPSEARARAVIAAMDRRTKT